MKILITSDWYTPAVNGVVTSVINLRKELERRGHEVRVLTLSQSPFSKEEDGVTYIGSIPAGRIYPGARLRTALAARKVWELIHWKPDIVHSQCEFSTFFIADYIARKTGAPLVHTYHTVYEDYTHYLPLSERLGKRTVATATRWISRRTDCLIAPTNKVRRLLNKYGVRAPIQVVPTGIQQGPFQCAVADEEKVQMRAQLGIPEERLILAAIGRLAEEKNVDELLRLRKDLGERPVTLLLVGDGPDRARLEQLRDALGLTEPDVIFAGMVPPNEVAKWYHLGDLFVSASTSETQGLTYIEALASGLPLLCRADECLQDVVEQDVNGWQYETAAEFTAHVDAVLAAPERRAEMASCAAQGAETFSAAVFAQRIEEIYCRLAEQIQAGAEIAEEFDTSLW